MPFAYDPLRMSSPTSLRSTRVLATILLLVATACGEKAERPAEPPTEDPTVALCAEARRTGREPLLSIRRIQSIEWKHDVVRREETAKVVGSGEGLGVVPFECRVEDVRPSPETAPAPDWLVNLLLPAPGLGGGKIEFLEFLPMTVFADADLRPISVLDSKSLVAIDTARAAIEQARSTRRRRDAEFAIADFLDGSDRAAALQRGLAVLDRWLVVRSYAAELAELVANGDDTVRSWAEPLLREHRVLRACYELRRAKGDTETISPRRQSEQLAPIVRRYADVPEVAMLAACIQGDAEWRLAIDDAGVERLCERVEAAMAGCSSPWRDIATMWLASTRR